MFQIKKIKLKILSVEKKNIFKDSETKKIYKTLNILFFILNIIIKINE